MTGDRIQDSGFRGKSSVIDIASKRVVIHSYKDLDVWKRSVNLVVTVYSLTKRFPKEELYTLVSQLRRSAISIPSNIAEGHSKRATKDYIRFVNIAYGSLAELETQLVISEKLNYLPAKDLEPLWEETKSIGRMLNGLISGLEKKLP